MTSQDFAGTEHYRERAAFFREHEPMVYHRPYREDLEALCDHIEDLEKQNEQAWERAALEARRVLKNGSKAHRLEQENAELRERAEELKGEIKALQTLNSDLRASNERITGRFKVEFAHKQAAWERVGELQSALSTKEKLGNQEEQG